jgi:hypothetical protein
MFWQTPQADSARTALMIASLTSLSVTVSSAQPLPHFGDPSPVALSASLLSTPEDSNP